MVLRIAARSGLFMWPPQAVACSDARITPHGAMASVHQQREAAAHPYPCNAISGRQRRCRTRSEEHTSELQSLMRISYAVFCLKKKKNNQSRQSNKQTNQQQYTRDTKTQ